jgi:transcriptional regulator with XRE-family HTH domain
MANSVIDDMNDPEFRKLLAQEELILEVTETICELLENETVSRKELAERLGKTKGFVSQLLNGGRNLTLRTVADILHVLEYKVSFTPYKEEENRQARKIVEFETSYTPPKKPVENWKKLGFSQADNYHNKKSAILGFGVPQ